MKKIIIILMGIGLIISGKIWANQPYSGNPTMDKLTASLKNAGFMTQVPVVKVKELTYYSWDRARWRYSNYHIHPGKQVDNVIQYWTKEHVFDGSDFPGITRGAAIVHGKGVSFGGIFWPLEKMTIDNSQGQQVFYNKIDIDSVKYISGHLFPMEVGNDLKFHFTRIQIQKFDHKTMHIDDSGIMEYKVIKKLTNFPQSITPVPGDVYRLEVLESTKRDPQFHLTDIYEYAPKLGWYIADAYFKNHRKIGQYYMHDFQYN